MASFDQLCTTLSTIQSRTPSPFSLPWSASEAAEYRELEIKTPYTWIRKNVLVCSKASRAALQCEAAEQCGCHHGRDVNGKQKKKGAAGTGSSSSAARGRGVLCNEDCVNVLTKVECTKETCEFARDGTCENNCFQRTTRADIEKIVRVVRTPGRGHGVVLKDGAGPIKPGTFLMEFSGEIIDAAEFERRSTLRSGVVVGFGGFDEAAVAAAESKSEQAAEAAAATMSSASSSSSSSSAAAAASTADVYGATRGGTGHQYVMDLGGGLMVDATRKGNVSRLINHSCEPNCVVEKWAVGGVARLGIFARTELVDGLELSFDYQFCGGRSVPTKCLCGAASCRGFLGASKSSSKAESEEKNKVPIAEANRRWRAAQHAKLREQHAKRVKKSLSLSKQAAMASKKQAKANAKAKSASSGKGKGKGRGKARVAAAVATPLLQERLSFIKLWNSSVRGAEVQRIAFSHGGSKLVKAAGEEAYILRSCEGKAAAKPANGRHLRVGLREALHSRLREVWHWCDEVERTRGGGLDGRKVESLRERLIQLSGSSTCLSHRAPSDFVLGEVDDLDEEDEERAVDKRLTSGSSVSFGGGSSGDVATKRSRSDDSEMARGGRSGGRGRGSDFGNGLGSGGSVPRRKKQRLSDPAAFDETGGEEGEDLDLNEHCCRRCGGAGQLICCDSCPASFHVTCAGLYNGSMPKGKWSCRSCRKRGSKRSWGCSDADLIAMGILTG